MAAKLKEKQQTTMYRVYITDSLKAIGGLNVRYYDMINRKVETRTEEEIVEGIRGKLKGLPQD